MIREIDPDGDLLIALTPSSEPFADEALFDAEAGDQKDCTEFGDIEPETEESPLDNMPPAPDMVQDASMTEPEQIDDPVPQTFQFKVSSKNMASSSRRFKKMLSGVWLEATTIHTDGMRHVDMEGFDAEAFTIVMYLIHGRNRKDVVPREVELEMLAKIAVVTDDLGCYDAVALASEVWLEALKSTLNAASKQYNRTMIISLVIVCVFADSTRFNNCVRTAVWESRGPIPTMGLPIPGRVVGTRLDTKFC